MDPSFDIKILERDHTVIVQVEGELDLATAPLLDEKLAEAESAGARSVLLDLDRVEFMDSTGLQLLLARVILNGDGKRFALTTGSPQVQRLFRVAGVLDRLPFAGAPDA
jgi:anti-sigma B factor antagonist